MGHFRNRLRQTIGALAAAPGVLALVLSALVSGCGGEAVSAAAAPSFRSVSLLAGSLDPGGRGDADGTGQQARFFRPQGLAVATDGSLWLSETGGQRIRRITADRRVQTVLTLAALSPGVQQDGRTIDYYASGAIVADPSGGVFVAIKEATWIPTSPPVKSRWAILRVTSEGRASMVARFPVADMLDGEVSALAVDRSGRLYVAEFRRCTIWRVDPSGASEAPAGPVQIHAESPRGVGLPCDLYETALDFRITRLVVDEQDRPVFTRGGGELRRIEHDGSVSTLGHRVGVGWLWSAMAFDRQGRLLLTDGGRQVWVHDNGITRPWVGDASVSGWTDGAAAEARFAKASGIAVDADGNAFVADVEANTVRRIDRQGTVTTWAGLALQDDYREGRGDQVRFSAGFGLGAGRNGSLVVADTSNFVVREALPDGQVVTIAGLPGQRAGVLVDGPVATTRVQGVAHALIAGDGSLWMSDFLVIRRVGRDGQLRTISDFGLSGGPVTALARDAAGRPLATVGGQSFDFDGSVVSHFALYRWPTDAAPGSTPEQLALRWPTGLWERVQGGVPAGLCASPAGDVYFTVLNAVIRRAPDGALMLWAGDPRVSGAADGDGVAARFNRPRGIGCDDSGVYVADTDNHTVRHIDTKQRVSTVLGQAGSPGVPSGAVPGRLHQPSSVVPVPGGLAVGTGLGIAVARP